MTTYPAADLVRFYKATLERLVQTGFEAPIMLLVVSGREGYAWVMRWRGTEEAPEIIFAHPKGEATWLFPVQVIFVDSRGECVRATLNENDTEPEFVN